MSPFFVVFPPINKIISLVLLCFACNKASALQKLSTSQSKPNANKIVRMYAILLFILAGIILVVNLWQYVKKHSFHNEDTRSDYLKVAVDKLRGNIKPKQSFWKWLFQSNAARGGNYYRNEYLKSYA